MTFSTKFQFDGEELTAFVSFYQNNAMPAILLMDQYDREYGVLTTNLTRHIERTVSIRSDDNRYAQLLIENGWITDNIVHSQPSGFIAIHYYELTDEGFAEIEKAANKQGVSI